MKANSADDPCRKSVPGARLLLAFTAACLGAFALGPAGDPLPAQQARAAPTVEGTLVGPGGEAAAGVEVQLLASPNSYVRRLRELGVPDSVQVVDRARSDADGRFHLTAPRVGPYRLEILPAIRDTSRPATPAPVYQDLRPLTGAIVLAPIHLPDVHRLTVEVTDEAGKPVEGAQVLAQATRWSDRERNWSRRVDSAGGLPFEERPIDPIFGRAAGRTNPSGLAHFLLPTVDANVFVFAPGFELRASLIEGRGRYELRPDSGVTLRVVDSDGSPVAGAVIRVGEENAIPLALANERGEATVGLNGGEDISFQVETVDRAAGRTEPIPIPEESSQRPHVVEVGVAPALEIVGQAVDAETGQSIEGASIWFRSRDGDHAWSGRDGGFRLRTRPGLEPVRLASAADGYLSDVDIPVDASRLAATLAIALTPAARITGVVTDASDQPVAGARLSVDPGGPARTRLPPSARASVVRFRSSANLRAISAADGSFRLAELDRTSPHRIRVRASGFAEAVVDLPAAGLTGEAQPVRIVLQRGRRVFGTVTDEAGNPVAEATIGWHSARRGPGGSLTVYYRPGRPAATNGDGYFELPNVSAGTYQYSVEHESHASVEPRVVDIPAGEGDTELDAVVLAPGTGIEGRVLGPDGRPLAGARISAHQRAAGGIDPEDDSRTVTTDGEGRFRLSGLRAGLARVTALASGFAQRVLEAVRPDPRDEIEIVMERGATLTGRVVDASGAAVPNALVRLQQSNERLFSSRPAHPEDGIRRAGTDLEGRFRFEDLPEATWTVDVRSPSGSTSCGEAELVVSQEGTVHLEAEEVREIKLVLRSPEAELSVTVRNREGASVPANVSLLLQGGGTFSTRTDPLGRFTFDRTCAGDAVTLAVTHPEYRGFLRELTIEPGLNEVPAVLEPGLQITGTVRTAGGSPLPLAVVEAKPVSASPPNPRLRGQEHLRSMFLRNTVDAPNAALTDQNGGFRLRGLGAGTYHVVASADGYGTNDAENPVRLERASAEGVEIVLQGEATLEIQMRDAPDGRVSVSAQQSDENRQAIELADDRFSIRSLGPGRWTVHANAASGQTVQQAVDLTPSEQVSLELTFPTGIRVSGRVTVAGRVSGGGHVVFHRGDQALQTELDPNGRFEMTGLQPGPWDVQVSVYGSSIRELVMSTLPFSGTFWQRQVNLQGDQDLHFSLDEPALLTGVVTNAENGQPLPGARLTTILDAGAALPRHGGLAVTDTEGRFELRSSAGAWNLTVQYPEFREQRLPVELVSGEFRSGLAVALTPETAGPE